MHAIQVLKGDATRRLRRSEHQQQCGYGNKPTHQWHAGFPDGVDEVVAVTRLARMPRPFAEVGSLPAF
ncbi:hypothetical protein ANT2_4572 [plant metagenome]|uniref:Uncharacterized protein n=1 Tax=plant metagenome TaxID=1297885 RepID=A0A484RAR4_9ZZZZ